MPFTLNGVGTWYYGKRRIHTLKGTCEFCGRETDLVSYDTTLFFVVVFLPVIPLSQKRILQQCAVCGKHRVTSLAKWEEAKAKDCGDLLDRLNLNPNDRDAVMRAVALAIAYQDEPLLNNVVELMAGKWTRDAGVQALLGDAYVYFAHWPNAAEAYHASLAVDDTDPVREQLGWALLKQDRPDEARPYLQHVIDDKKRDAAGLVYYLIKGYQAQGRHDEALEIMDERDQAFPDFVTLKEYQRQRKDSTRYQGTDKKIRSALLAEGKSGYSEGNWTSRLPRWIAAGVLLGGLCLYLGLAFWAGHARKIYVVNGTSRPYAVMIQGTEHMLAPNAATRVFVAEGDVQVAFKDANLGLEPVHARIETSFWSRPFVSPTFVINPDEAAVVLEEDTFYSAVNPRAGSPPVVHFGNSFYSMTGIDYEFENFPSSIQANQTSQVRKTRVTLAPSLVAELRLGLLQKLDPQEQIKICQRLLRIDPNNSLFLYWLAIRLPPEEAIKFVESRLDDRPLLVEWHRMYQSLMERAHPDTDLRPRYHKILADLQGNADAIYLIARIDPNLDDAEKLFHQAAEATPPSGYAFYALGYHALCEGRFGDAGGWFEKALPLMNEKMLAEQMYRDALLANGDYDKLLRMLTMGAQPASGDATASTIMMRAYAIRGDKQMARKQLEATVLLYPHRERDKIQKTLESILCCCENNLAGYLQSEGDTPSFEATFLRGQLDKAAELVSLSKQDASIYHGLLYLEATRSAAKELAETHWKGMLSELKKGGRDQKLFGDILSGDKSQGGRLAQRLPIEPQIKRVLLAVYAQRYPGQAKEMLSLAKRLDFQHDGISLCLAKYLK